MKPIAATAIVLALFTGCVEVTDEEEAVELGATEQALTGTDLRHWTCTPYQTCHYDLGTVTGRACFLGGVQGTTYRADVAISQEAGRWVLDIWSDGHSNWITTTCVSPATNLTPIATWTSGNPSVDLGAGLGRRCFLTGVSAYPQHGLATTSDYVRTFRNAFTGHWYLGGSTSQAATASAACIDVTTDVIVSDTAPGYTKEFTYLTATPNTACALTRLSGSFQPAQEHDGVWVDYDDDGFWFLSMGGTKGTATVECFQ